MLIKPLMIRALVFLSLSIAALAGEKPSPLVEEIPPGGTRLYLHPTLWEYVRQRFVKGVR